MQVVLHDHVVRLDVVAHLRIGEDDLVNFLAVDAAALFEDDRQPLAFGLGSLDVLRDVAEGDGEPVFLVQAVISDAGRTRHRRRR